MELTPWTPGHTGNAIVFGSKDNPGVASWATVDGSPHHYEVAGREGIGNFIACEIAPDGGVSVLYGDPTCADDVVNRTPGTHKVEGGLNFEHFGGSSLSEAPRSASKAISGPKTTNPLPEHLWGLRTAENGPKIIGSWDAASPQAVQNWPMMGRTPFIYHEPEHTVYIGHAGDHHVDLRAAHKPLLDEFGSAMSWAGGNPGQHEGIITHGLSGMDDRNRWPDGVEFLTHQGHPEVLDAVSSFTGLPVQRGFDFLSKASQVHWVGEPGLRRSHSMWVHPEHGLYIGDESQEHHDIAQHLPVEGPDKWANAERDGWHAAWIMPGDDHVESYLKDYADMAGAHLGMPGRQYNTGMDFERFSAERPWWDGQAAVLNYGQLYIGEGRGQHSDVYRQHGFESDGKYDGKYRHYVLYNINGKPTVECFANGDYEPEVLEHLKHQTGQDFQWDTGDDLDFFDYMDSPKFQQGVTSAFPSQDPIQPTIPTTFPGQVKWVGEDEPHLDVQKGQSYWYHPEHGVVTGNTKMHHGDLSRHLGLPLDPDYDRIDINSAKDHGWHQAWLTGDRVMGDNGLHHWVNPKVEYRDPEVRDAIARHLGLPSTDEEDDAWDFNKFAAGEWDFESVPDEDDDHGTRWVYDAPTHHVYTDDANKYMHADIAENNNIEGDIFGVITPKGEIEAYGSYHDPATIEYIVKQIQSVYPNTHFIEGYAHGYKIASSALTPWTPGNYGKFVIDPKGQVHHWATGDEEDSQPHHADAMALLGLDQQYYRETEREDEGLPHKRWTPGWILPDGETEVMRRHEDRLPLVFDQCPGTHEFKGLNFEKFASDTRLKRLVSESADYGEIYVNDQDKKVMVNMGDADPGWLIDEVRTEAQKVYPGYSIEIGDEAGRPQGYRRAYVYDSAGNDKRGVQREAGRANGVGESADAQGARDHGARSGQDHGNRDGVRGATSKVSEWDFEQIKQPTPPLYSQQWYEQNFPTKPHSWGQGNGRPEFEQRAKQKGDVIFRQLPPHGEGQQLLTGRVNDAPRFRQQIAQNYGQAQIDEHALMGNMWHADTIHGLYNDTPAPQIDWPGVMGQRVNTLTNNYANNPEMEASEYEAQIAKAYELAQHHGVDPQDIQAPQPQEKKWWKRGAWDFGTHEPEYNWVWADGKVSLAPAHTTHGEINIGENSAQGYGTVEEDGTVSFYTREDPATMSAILQQIRYAVPNAHVAHSRPYGDMDGYSRTATDWGEYYREIEAQPDPVVEPWAPGSPGKAFMNRDTGEVHHWKTDAPHDKPSVGVPHHSWVADQKGMTYPFAASAWIHPDGGVEFPYLNSEPSTEDEMRKVVKGVGGYRLPDTPPPTMSHLTPQPDTFEEAKTLMPSDSLTACRAPHPGAALRRSPAQELASFLSGQEQGSKPQRYSTGSIPLDDQAKGLEGLYPSGLYERQQLDTGERLIAAVRRMSEPHYLTRDDALDAWEGLDSDTRTRYERERAAEMEEQGLAWRSGRNAEAWMDMWWETGVGERSVAQAQALAHNRTAYNRPSCKEFLSAESIREHVEILDGKFANEGLSINDEGYWHTPIVETVNRGFSPGQPGKGVVLADGRVLHWNTDPFAPHHGEVLDALRYHGDPVQGRHRFEISPDGEVQRDEGFKRYWPAIENAGLKLNDHPFDFDQYRHANKDLSIKQARNVQAWSTQEKGLPSQSEPWSPGHWGSVLMKPDGEGLHWKVPVDETGNVTKDYLHHREMITHMGNGDWLNAARGGISKGGIVSWYGKPSFDAEPHLKAMGLTTFNPVSFDFEDRGPTSSVAKWTPSENLDWDFVEGSYHKADAGWTVHPGSATPMDTLQGDDGVEYDHMPILMDEGAKRLYIGQSGTHHIDLHEEFGYGHPQAGISPYKDGWELWHYGTMHPGVMEAVSKHVNAPVYPSAFDFEHMSKVEAGAFNFDFSTWQPGEPLPKWEPGLKGKGMFYKGRPYSWATDKYEYPHHADAQESVDPKMTTHPEGYFHISPDGTVVAEGYGDAHTFAEHDPRLKPYDDGRYDFSGYKNSAFKPPKMVEMDQPVGDPFTQEAYGPRKAFLYYPEHNTVYLGSPGAHHGDIQKHFNLPWAKGRMFGVAQTGLSQGFGQGEVGVRAVGCPDPKHQPVIDYLANHYGIPGDDLSKSPMYDFESRTADAQNQQRAMNDTTDDILDLLGLGGPASEPRPLSEWDKRQIQWKAKRDAERAEWEQDPMGAEKKQWDNLHQVSHPDVQWVPTHMMKPFIEYDRRPGGEHSLGNTERWEELANHIKQNGFKNEAVLEYNPDTGAAYLGEGNHRTWIALEHGIPAMPVRVNRSRRTSPTQVPVTLDPQPEWHDHRGELRVPDSLKPEHIGLPTVPPPGSTPHNSVYANARTYYHVAPADVRDNFQAHGPQQFAPTENSSWEGFGGVHTGSGFYAWNSLLVATEYRNRLSELRGKPHDIWEVRAPGGWFDEDPEIYYKDAEKEYGPGAQSLIYTGDKPLTNYRLAVPAEGKTAAFTTEPPSVHEHRSWIDPDLVHTGWGQRRPMIYEPTSNTLHIGSLASTHPDLAQVVKRSMGIYVPSLMRDADQVYEGWLGHNPEGYERKDDISNQGMHNEYGWYTKHPGPHVDAALANHFAARPESPDYNFEHFGAVNFEREEPTQGDVDSGYYKPSVQAPEPEVFEHQAVDSFGKPLDAYKYLWAAEGRRPIVYHPESNQVHIGSPGEVHFSLTKRVREGGGPDIPKWDNPAAFHGWLGHNPEHRPSQWVAPGTYDTDNEYGWYGGTPGPHVDAALGKHFNAQPEGDGFDFEHFGKTASLPPDFIHTQMHPDDSEWSTWVDHDEHALLYDHPAHTVYVGKPGIHHDDLIQEFGLSPSQYSGPQGGLSYGDVVPSGAFQNHGGFEHHPEVVEHIKNYFDAHKRPDNDEWGWDFDKFSKTATTIDGDQPFGPVLYYPHTDTFYCHAPPCHGDYRRLGILSDQDEAHPGVGYRGWISSKHGLEWLGLREPESHITQGIANQLGVGVRDHGFDFESKTSMDDDNYHWHNPNVKIHTPQDPGAGWEPTPPHRVVSAPMIYDHDADTLHIGSEDDVHHQDIWPHVLNSGANPGYVDLADKTYQFYDRMRPEHRALAEQHMQSYYGFPLKDMDGMDFDKFGAVVSAPPEIEQPHPMVYWPHTGEIRIGQPYEHHEDVEMSGPQSNRLEEQGHRAIVRPGAIDWLYHEPPQDHDDVDAELTYHYGQPFETTNGFNFEHFATSFRPEYDPLELARQEREREQQRLSEPPVYYHQAPTGDRARIMQHGLQVSDPTVRTPWLKGEAKGGPGVYAVGNPGDLTMLQAIDEFDWPHDIWKINHPAIPGRDPDYNRGYIYQHNIDPQHLELHQPWENHYENLWPAQTAELERYDAMDDAAHAMRDYRRNPPDSHGKRTPLLKRRYPIAKIATWDDDYWESPYPDHMDPWQPTKLGKGLVSPGGRAYTWQIDEYHGRDGYPSHADALNSIHRTDEPDIFKRAMNDGWSFYTINHDGSYDRHVGPPEHEEIMKAHLPQEPFCWGCGHPVQTDEEGNFDCPHCKLTGDTELGRQQGLDFNRYGKTADIDWEHADRPYIPELDETPTATAQVHQPNGWTDPDTQKYQRQTRSPFWVQADPQRENHYHVRLGLPGMEHGEIYHVHGPEFDDWKNVASGGIMPAGSGKIGPWGPSHYPNDTIEFYQNYMPHPIKNEWDAEQHYYDELDAQRDPSAFTGDELGGIADADAIGSQSNRESEAMHKAVEKALRDHLKGHWNFDPAVDNTGIDFEKFATPRDDQEGDLMPHNQTKGSSRAAIAHESDDPDDRLSDDEKDRAWQELPYDASERAPSVRYAEVNEPIQIVPAQGQFTNWTGKPHADPSEVTEHVEATVLNAMDGERMVGSIIAYPDWDEPTVLSLESVWVDPEYRRRGVGLQLIEAAKRAIGARTVNGMPQTPAGRGLLNRARSGTPHEGASADPSVMYHVAPYADRSSMQAHGIDWRARDQSRDWRDDDESYEFYPMANYLTTSLDKAREYAGVSDGDIWKVDATGHKLTPDVDGDWSVPGRPWETTAYRTKKRITPDRLELHETHPNSPPHPGVPAFVRKSGVMSTPHNGHYGADEAKDDEGIDYADPLSGEDSSAWKILPKSLDDLEPWKPGSEGKGIICKDGEVVTWTDMAMHHNEVYTLLTEAHKRPKTLLDYIHPDGTTLVESKDPADDELLIKAGMHPTHIQDEGAWDFNGMGMDDWEQGLND